MDYKQILADIARAIVDTPDSVSVTEQIDGDNIELTLSVAPEDMGMVIGRHGKIAKAIRSLMKAAAANSGKRITVEIR
ncbi:MAG: KH domain-containing protein [Clostridia bacterium]|nr:KH domain-containing protein [Clostridia bacterium]